MAGTHTAQRPWQVPVALMLAVLGGSIILLSFTVGLVGLTPTAGDYYADNPKLARDAAGVDTTTQSEFDAVNGLIAQINAANLDTQTLGRELLPDLESLEATPRWKEPLTFLGVASFMIGIALAFSSIPRLLRLRGMAIRDAIEQMTHQTIA